MRDDHRQDFRRRLMHVVDAIDDNHPEILIAGGMRLVISTAFALLGEEMSKQFGALLVESSRRRNGLCQLCDNDVAATLTHEPICETCDARLHTQITDVLGEGWENENG
jgi:hypothetical protein